MMKRAVANILRRKTTAEFLGKNNHRDTLCFDAFINRIGITTARQDNDKLYASYKIYKGKAALSIEPVMPSYRRIDSGGMRVDRQGVMMLEFSPAIGELKYDWEKKQLFALSPTETGLLISLGPKESCEFFHDPSMKSSNAGQVRKTLKIRPGADTGYFFSLNVVNKPMQTNETLSIPISLAEFAVMRTAFSYALPHIMGWSGYASQHPIRLDSSWKGNELLGSSAKRNSRNSDLEWEK